MVDALPRALGLLVALHRIGRDLEQHVGGELLLGVIGHRASLLLGCRPRGRAVVGHGELDRVFDHLELAAGGLGRVREEPAERRVHDPRRHLLAGLHLAADHHSLESLRSGGKGTELCAGQSGHQCPVGGVDNRLGHHRLATGPIGHHDSAGTAGGVAEDVRHHAAIEKLDPRGQQHVVQRSLDVHRAGHRTIRLRSGGLEGRRHDLDLAQQDSIHVVALLDVELHVSGFRSNRSRQDGHVLGRPVLNRRRLLPSLLVLAGGDSDTLDDEVLCPLARRAAVEHHQADLVDLVGLLEIGNDGDVAVVLHALA